MLHDSNLILQYVESVVAPKTLWQGDAPKLASALRITANALVALEKTVQCVYERQLRPPEKQHQPWLDRVIAQRFAAYDVCVKNAADDVTTTLYLRSMSLTQTCDAVYP